MNSRNEFLTDLLRCAKEAAGVPVYSAPTSAAGEKIIWRTTPRGAKFPVQGMTLSLKFISRDPHENISRADAVTRAICTVGDALLSVEEDSGEGGYIGRTGHFYLTVRYRVEQVCSLI